MFVFFPRSLLCIKMPIVPALHISAGAQSVTKVITNSAVRELIFLVDRTDGLVESTQVTADLSFSENKSVEWVSSTYNGSHMVNIFKCISLSEPICFVAIFQGDGGFIGYSEGPFASLHEAQSYIPTDEAWTCM